MNLSPHFTIEELSASEYAAARGIDNTPSEAVAQRLTALCVNVLEPARNLLAVPFRVNSGYRCESLNMTLGGAAGSQHLTGEACDFVPQGMDLGGAFDRMVLSDIPYDQAIWEPSWLHFSFCPDRPSRRQALKATLVNGTMQYHPYTPQVRT